MPDHQILNLNHGRDIAYHKTSPQGDGVYLPGIVFLGGFRSDMEGTKALYLEAWAKQRGRAFLRFDYTGHGSSSRAFLDGCIGEWAQDSADAISALTHGPQILVGSSMGGWIALWLAQRTQTNIAGLVGIAAAPDFTEDSMWAGFDETQRRELHQTGQVALPSEYSEGPYIITRKLIEDGREQLVLRRPLNLPFPTRLLQGSDDADVDQSVPLRLLTHATCPDLRLILVKGEDHRFSSDVALRLIGDTLSTLPVQRSSE